MVHRYLPQRLIMPRGLAWALIAFTVGANAEDSKPEKLESSSAIAETRLNELFSESTAYIRTHRGPNSSDEGAESESRAQGLASIGLTPPVASPHGSPSNQTTEEQDQASLHWAEWQAAANNPRGKYEMGLRYLVGQGIPRNSEQAVQLLKQSASNGYADAMFALAQMYEDGVQVPKDMSAAIRYYRECADAKATFANTAKIRLGEIYQFGLGVPADYNAAMREYMEVANYTVPEGHFLHFMLHDLGPAVAEEHIAWMYAEGQGVSTSASHAAEWFLKSTNFGKGYGGDRYPQCALAIMYGGGVGVPKDLDKARFWLDKPATRTSTECKHITE